MKRYCKDPFQPESGIIIQVRNINEVAGILSEKGISYVPVGHPVNERSLFITSGDFSGKFDIDALRDKWFRTSYLLDRMQTGNNLAEERFSSYAMHDLN